ncbi:fructose-6-phosphate2-kinase/fructose-2,6-bisphosphatase [Trypanosoma grayi]|uniref:fructose-6-phosphate2-kinase/fructose-2, 6-bisphosphatase n=1 Tax=Trypanosoma grayi TaxID=71804 RepID=UPI0004F4560E|nr:fructose-6-phosphate2-kinase/fructose-2,6-bisphosphatase [Trypanosoma grayi]KEG13442.1 fructose-6-phosphate2-kinase/fructose-2,6-bisphosphatase [Trypanosoma grayi]
MSVSMLPLQSSISADDALPENSINFCKFVGPNRQPRGCVFSPHPRRQSDKVLKAPSGRWNTTTNAVFIVVSSSPRCNLVARFFCSKLLHYLRWCGESVMFFLGGQTERDVEVQRFEDDSVAWEKYVGECVEKSLEYIASDPPLGFAEVPVVILRVDCETTEAYGKLNDMLEPKGNFLIRHIWFDEDWRESSRLGTGYIDVCLKRPALRVTRCRRSIICSKATSYLNNCLPALQRVYLHEPLVGSVEDTMKSFCPVFFTRHGESEYNLQDRLGGDPDLTASGRDDALAIAEFFRRQVVHNKHLFAARNTKFDEEEGFEVWCSQLKRTVHTAGPSASVLTRGELRMFKTLNEIHAGVCEDMTNEEIKSLYPSIQFFRHTDKVGFRYPNGESYRDLMRRLEPLLLDLHVARKCVLVVAHQAVLRTVLSFFDGPSVEEAVHKPCPHRTIWCCTYNRLGEPRLTTVTLGPRKNTCVVEDAKWSGW